MSRQEETVEVKAKLQKTRRLRVGQNKSQTTGEAVAAIRISGLYLHGLGFDPYGFFDMTINPDGSLTIKSVSPEQAEADEAAAKAARNAIK